MIQRIQSVYLFLITLLSLLFFNGNYLNFIDRSGSAMIVNFTGIIKSTEGSGFELISTVWPLIVIFVLISVVSFITIFLFKKRDIQLLFSKILIGLISASILVSVFYSYQVTSKYSAMFIPGVKMIVPVILLLLSVLAFRGIRRDDNLVKSYDRLR
jgi:hypothetical protein